MTPTFEEIKAARGKCPDCENGEIDAIVKCFSCPTCHGTSNGILTFLIPIEAPEGYKYRPNIGNTSAWFINELVIETEEISKHWSTLKPYKINQPIPVTCEACGGDGEKYCIKRCDAKFSDITACQFLKDCDDRMYVCPSCNGNPKTELTVLDIQVVKTDQWYFSVKVLEGI